MWTVLASRPIGTYATGGSHPISGMLDPTDRVEVSHER
jgi:hypothetical protein